MARRLRISVDHDTCAGNAMCTVITPDVFRLDDKHKSSVANPEGDTEERVLEAARNCPVGAFPVADAETGKQLFP